MKVKSIYCFTEDYVDLDDDGGVVEDDWDSEIVSEDPEYGQKKNEEEEEDVYLVPTINYETYKDESAAKKRVNYYSAIFIHILNRNFLHYQNLISISA